MTLKEELKTYFEQEQKPLSIHEIENAFEYYEVSEFKALLKTLNELEDAGEIVRTRQNYYGLPEKMNLVRGTIDMAKKGFAFLIRDDGQTPDIYLHHSDLNSAMDEDEVLVRIDKKKTEKARPEGSVVRILKRAHNTIVGTYQASKRFGFVIPDDKSIQGDIFIPKKQARGAVTGHKVLVTITKYPEENRRAEGAISKIIGHKNDPGVDILSIIYQHDIDIEFDEKVLKEVEKAPERVTKADLLGRKDLRDKTIVTIDGADAKDLDDAIRVEKLKNGNYLLGVYIADVSYYVREDTAIDNAAYARGTSVYLVDRVIPMLPHKLSNGICSLNKGEDRLVLACEMEIDKKGKVVQHEIFEAVICTTERMTYYDVNQIIVDNNEETIKVYETLVPMFTDMKDLAGVLEKKRQARGAIDFDFPEAEIKVDENGVPTDIVLRDRDLAEKLIESFMLCANETIAEAFHWLEVPFIHRIHEKPEETKLHTFFEFLSSIGHGVKGKLEDVHPLELQKVLTKIKGQPEEKIVGKLLLRSMQQARYADKSKGHFGLSTDFYTHFTSPIRRYPDLIVHRLIRTYLLDGDVSGKNLKKWQKKLPDIAKHSSNKERDAVSAERAVNDLKKAEFMQDKIGETFEATISSVTSFGVFVELDNTVEGLIHVSYMTDDYYQYHEAQQAMIGEMHHKVYRVGEKVTVTVLDVNVEERNIDFVFEN